MSLKKLFAFIGLLGVILSAFGSHYLKSRISSEHIQTWTTASFYLFVHVIVGLYACQFVARKRSQTLFLWGILFFSGSLYILVLTKVKIFGLITPIGGILFILGWLFLALDLK